MFHGKLNVVVILDITLSSWCNLLFPYDLSKLLSSNQSHKGTCRKILWCQ